MQRYFVDTVLQENEIYTDLNIDTHHIFNVMRMSIGDKIEVVDKNKDVFIVKIIEDTPFKIEVISTIQSVESNIKVSVYAPILKGDKLDFMLQKSTELGAEHFYFYNADRSVVKLDEKKKQKRKIRFEKIVTEASEQSKRNTIPTIEFLGKLKSIDFSQYDNVFIGYEDVRLQENKKFASALNKEDNHIAIIFGPEGGFTESEVASHNNFTIVQLGKRILRAETAPLYMLSVIDSIYN
ncbi:RsmE family RNA methyltransferase [Nosocomiicoccus massiliensis]|uniref:RsmE family RNA methyltransferase n=1 Tax=Nosocomiicoccus massiliensis TaxID=1232430 RepID=UPI000405670D|nr:RsmE family RNA methyltransferase [Nosocomiicoccus massiliensis]